MCGCGKREKEKEKEWATGLGLLSIGRKGPGDGVIHKTPSSKVTKVTVIRSFCRMINVQVFIQKEKEVFTRQ